MKVSNEELYKRTSSQDVVIKIKRRRIRWLGHILRIIPELIPKIAAIRWTPAGRRRQGRAKITWRLTIQTELKEMGLTWGDAQQTANDRNRWRKIANALCPIRDEVD